MPLLILLAVLLPAMRAAACPLVLHEPAVPDEALLMVIEACEGAVVEIEPPAGGQPRLVSLQPGRLWALLGPAGEGLHTFVVRVCDAEGNCDESYFAFVSSGRKVSVRRANDIPPMVIGEPYEAQLVEVAGGVVTVESSTLPEGLRLTADGMLVGTPRGPEGRQSIVVEGLECGPEVARFLGSARVEARAPGNDVDPAACPAQAPQTGCQAAPPGAALALLTLLLLRRRGSG